MISPWVIGFSGLTTITIHNVIVGLAASLLAIGYAAAFGRTHGLAWVLPVIGVWAIISPWLVSGEVNVTEVVLNNVIVGAVIVLLGLITVAVGMRRMGARRAEE